MKILFLWKSVVDWVSNILAEAVRQKALRNIIAKRKTIWNRWIIFYHHTLLPVPYSRILNIRERSPLILGTRAEDNFTQLEQISYPVLNIKTFSYPHHLSAKWFSNPSRSLSAKNLDQWKDTKLSQAIFIPFK